MKKKKKKKKKETMTNKTKLKNVFALFLGIQDGSTFKVQFKFAPYFYVGTKVNKSDVIL